MLSISPPLHKETAEKYYQRDNYYLDSPGEWYGQMAQKLGLSGIVEENDFKALLDGKSPTGEALVKSSGSELHRCGVDLTFSAPKSVSLLAYKDERIEAAFQKALQSTLDHTEKNYAQSRFKHKDGTFDYTQTGKMLFSTFMHRTSRELDPQLHAHCIVYNITEENGQTKTLHNDQLFKNKMYLGQFFRNELAAQIQKLGYKVDITDRSHGFFEIEGVDSEIIDAFSQRRKQVLEEIKGLRELRYCDCEESQINNWAHENCAAYEKSPEYALHIAQEIQRLSQSTNKPYESWSDAQLSALATLNSRDFKKDVTREKIVEHIENVCAGFDTSLNDIAQQCRTIADTKPAKFSPKDIINNAVAAITEQQAAFTREDVLQHAMKLAIGNGSYSEIEAEFEKQMHSGAIKQLGTHTTKSGNIDVFSSQAMISIEQSVMGFCSTGKGTCSVELDIGLATNFIEQEDRALVQNQCAKLADDILAGKKPVPTYLTEPANSIPREKLIEAIAENESFSGFSKGQVAALKQIISSKDKVSIVQGDAGAGKSFAVNYANKLMVEHGYTVYGLAPTGKATDGLAKAANLKESTTVDSLLLTWRNASSEKKNELIKKGKCCFVVDEAGMLGSKKLNELLKIADEMDSKVVLIGDRKQFASIEAGKMFADLQDKTNIDKCEMREVIRQKTDQTIGIVASISAKNYTESFLRMSGFEESPDQINMKAGQKIIVNGNLYHIHSIDKDGTLHTTSTQFGATRESSFHPSEIEEYTLYDANAKYKNTITINNDPNQRLNAVVDDYLTSLKNKQECLVITPTNDDRKEINSRIRESLVADGTVETKGTFTLRESSSLGASAAQFANSYKIGQVLVANSEIDKLEKGAEAKIVGINRSKNEIIVEKTSADGKPEQHTIGVDKHYSKFTTYNVNQSELGINDQIVFLKNHKMGEGENAVRVNNGEIAKIKDIDKEGNVTVQFVDTPSKTITFNAHGKGDNAYQSIAHAYCLSEMKSQGMSVDKLIWHANSAKNINANSFYVAATRCKYDIAVYTDDLQRLMMKSSVEQHKFSTLDKFSKVKKSQLDATRTANLTENTTVPAVSNVEKEQQKSKKIDSPNVEL